MQTKHCTTEQRASGKSIFLRVPRTRKFRILSFSSVFFVFYKKILAKLTVDCYSDCSCCIGLLLEPGSATSKAAAT